MNTSTKTYLSKIGSKGGKKSRRILSASDAKKMVLVREAKRAFRKYYASCFWSYDPNYDITFEDIDWIVKNLQKNGDLSAWKKSQQLCR